MLLGEATDTRAAALVSSHGSIDGCGPASVISRRYRDNSATFETTWRTTGVRLTLTEGMVAEVSGGGAHVGPGACDVRAVRPRRDTQEQQTPVPKP